MRRSKPTRGQIEATQREREHRRWRVGLHGEELDRLKADYVEARELPGEAAANAVFDAMVAEHDALQVAERDLLELEHFTADGGLLPDPNSPETLRAAEGLKRRNQRTAKRRGHDTRYWRKSLAHTRRHRRSAEFGAVVRRTPIARPAARRRTRTRRTPRASRAGPDDSGDSEPPGEAPARLEGHEAGKR